MWRKLAAILNADVAGYSRLMEEDEAATLATLVAHQAIIENAIIDHAGRLVGDVTKSEQEVPLLLVHLRQALPRESELI
jgi:class 3 adenylate cyclase